jgi:hypothetical protein
MVPYIQITGAQLAQSRSRSWSNEVEELRDPMLGKAISGQDSESLDCFCTNGGFVSKFARLFAADSKNRGVRFGYSPCSRLLPCLAISISGSIARSWSVIRDEESAPVGK